jgi:hypothetical protein
VLDIASNSAISYAAARFVFQEIRLGQEKTLRIWLDDAETVDHIETQRYYFPTATKRIESVTLHGFCDTSMGAYCAVVYLCVKKRGWLRDKSCGFKDQSSPLYTYSITLPRHELIAALILARLVSTVNGALSGVINIEKTFCCRDYRS